MLFEVEDFTVFRSAPLHKVCKLSFLKYSLIPFSKIGVRFSLVVHLV